MISTILAILKIIGIVLLCIIGVVLFLVIWILFWPYHYSIRASKKDSIKGNVNLSFFFHFISVWVLYDKKVNFRIKVLGIPIFDKLRKESKKNKEIDNADDLESEEFAVEVNLEGNFSEDSYKQDNSSEHSDKQSDNNEDNQVDNLHVQENDSVSLNNESDDGIESENINIDDGNISDEDSDSSVDSTKEKKNFFDSLSEKIEHVFDVLSSIPDRIDKFADDLENKVDSIADTIIYYDNLLSKKGIEWVINYLKDNLIKILKSLKPYTGHVHIEYANEEPDKVGKIFEIYSLCMIFLPKKSSISIDYEDNYLRFDIGTKGYFSLGYIVIIALKVFFNRKVRKFIKLLKREDK